DPRDRPPASPPRPRGRRGPRAAPTHVTRRRRPAAAVAL
ncbi:MAG: hypothetical protein AVDCRST_MAG11-2252, partial [uncultured Gemmatimonadaceae bacterium]